MSQAMYKDTDRVSFTSTAVQVYVCVSRLDPFYAASRLVLPHLPRKNRGQAAH